MIRLCGDRLEIYSGDDTLNLPVMAVGAAGSISVLANVMPKETGETLAACRKGYFAAARRVHYRLLPLMRALFLETNPIPVKAALSMMGYCRDELRLPLLPMTEAPLAKLRSVMQQAGLIKC